MPSSAATVAALRALSFQWFTASSLYSAVKSVLPADGLLIWVFMGPSFDPRNRVRQVGAIQLDPVGRWAPFEKVSTDYREVAFNTVMKKIAKSLFCRFWWLRKFFKVSPADFWREAEQDMLHLLVPKNKISVDIGANHGEYTAQLANCSLHCHAFECNPQLADFLDSRFAETADVTIHRKAVSDSRGQIVFSIPYVNGRVSDGGATVSSCNKLDWADHVKELFVECVTIDHLNLNNLGFIKIDVEGHELAVLSGSVETLLRERPVFLVECEERHAPGGIQELGNFFGRYDYDIYFFEAGKLRPYSEFDIKIHQCLSELQKNIPRRCMMYVNNFVAVPSGSKILQS